VILTALARCAAAYSLLLQLTGGEHFITDVTNASRTLLMDIRTLQWDDTVLNCMGVPRCMLPEIRSSSEVRTYHQQVHCAVLYFVVCTGSVIFKREYAFSDSTV
jgi:glycerol kinase